MSIKQRVVRILLPVARLYWKTMKPKTFGVKVLVTHPKERDKVLLVLHSYGSKTLWNIPGGGYNPRKETAERAGCREIKQELGLRLTSPRIIGSYETDAEGKRDTVTIVTGSLESEEIPKTNFEITKIIWENLYTVFKREDVARVARRAIEFLRGETTTNIPPRS